jgi:hypothetical protein
MNFSFMIYIILAIMIYMSINKKVKLHFGYFFIALLVILLLNEIYNYGEYINKDNFADTWNEYQFENNFNPYEDLPEFRNVKIPFNYDAQLEAGIKCMPQKNLYKKKIMEQKLQLQDEYSNQILDVISGKPINSILSDDIFLPITDDMLNDKKCPTVCHLISDKNKCNSVREIPLFNDENQFNQWNDQREECSSLTEQTICGDNDQCNYNTDDGKCYSNGNLKKCFSYQSQGDNKRRIITEYDYKHNGKEVRIVSEHEHKNDVDVLFNDGKIITIDKEYLKEEAECYTKCEFLTENNCNSAIRSDGNKYCKIVDDENYNKVCKSTCDFITNENICGERTDCTFDSNICKDSS